MNNTQISDLIEEIRGEQHISPLEEDKTIIGYIKEAEFDINENVGAKIEYDVDLKARSLLKNYVLYCRYNRLAEFKQLYAGEYAYLQTKYYKPTDI
jgi:hypothetical protein|nr:MAG TPA: head to tail adaptor [Caudoviricetes sp.]